MNDVNESKTEWPIKSKKRRLMNTAAPTLHRQQENNEELERRIRSKDWIVNHPNESGKKICTACNPFEIKKSFTSQSERHLKTDRHKQQVLLAMARDAESKLSAFLAEHNIPLRVAEKLGPLLKDCFPDSKICQELTVNKEKVKSTIINLIAPDIKSKLANKLRTRKFSILADELTDISSAKTFCIMVRYFDDDTGRIKISFWKFCSMENEKVVDQEAVAEHLYEDIKESFIEFNIPDKNILGFGSDGCNVIMSGKNSVASRFKEDCPGIVIVKFINHSIHLCASKAAESLPRTCEELARVVHSSLKCKVNKSSHLVELQALFDLEPHGRLHPSQARWLSVTAVVDCMLKHWPELIRFYDGMSEQEKLSSGDEVLRWLRDPLIKLYYHFLHSVLCKFDELNALFKSSHEVITKVKAKIEDLYTNILECFLKRNYVKQTRLEDIDPWKKDEQLPDSEMDLGNVVLTEIKETMNDDKNYENKKALFYQCRRFLQKAAMEIGKRCVFGNSAIKHIEVLNPKVARSERDDPRAILRLAKALPRISSFNPGRLQRLSKQWCEFPGKSKNFPQDIAKENEPDLFWGKMLNWKNVAGETEFLFLTRFALDALVIPHTNADYERIFKEINLRRTGTSNKLVSDCEATCRVAISSGDIKRNGTGCMVFQRRTEIKNGVDSSTLQVEPKPIAATRQTLT